MIFLERDLLHTSKNEDIIWLVPHPFLFKNTQDIYWPNVGDMPSYDPNKDYHKIYNTGEKNLPFKFDVKIKNFRRIFLRDIFTQWHDSNLNCSIEDYANIHHHDVIWYRKNINNNILLEDIIKEYEKIYNSSFEEKFKWQKIYEQDKYYEYPYIIQKFIEFNKLEGIIDLEDLFYLDKCFIYN